MSEQLIATGKTKLRRIPKRGSYDVKTIYEILGEGFIAHVGFTAAKGQTFVIPTGYARRDNELLIHGSAASRMMRALTEEIEVCATVTLIDDQRKRRSCKLQKGLRLIADTDFEICPPLDALLIPGGDGRKVAMKNERILRFVKEQSQNAQAILSVCSGAFILQAAGLLEGLQATTHWSVAEQLRETGVQTVEERFVRNDGGKIWTSAGVSAGIDMALAFVAAQAGEEVAGQVQLEAEYYPSLRIYGGASIEEQTPKYVLNEAATVSQ